MGVVYPLPGLRLPSIRRRSAHEWRDTLSSRLVLQCGSCKTISPNIACGVMKRKIQHQRHYMQTHREDCRHGSTCERRQTQPFSAHPLYQRKPFHPTSLVISSAPFGFLPAASHPSCNPDMRLVIRKKHKN